MGVDEVAVTMDDAVEGLVAGVGQGSARLPPTLAYAGAADQGPGLPQIARRHDEQRDLQHAVEDVERVVAQRVTEPRWEDADDRSADQIEPTPGEQDAGGDQPPG
jgi:hypothetical protein